jgi:hypothetical protein
MSDEYACLVRDDFFDAMLRLTTNCLVVKISGHLLEIRDESIERDYSQRIVSG